MVVGMKFFSCLDPTPAPLAECPLVPCSVGHRPGTWFSVSDWIDAASAALVTAVDTLTRHYSHHPVATVEFDVAVRRLSSIAEASRFSTDDSTVHAAAHASTDTAAAVNQALLSLFVARQPKQVELPAGDGGGLLRFRVPSQAPTPKPIYHLPGTAADVVREAELLRTAAWSYLSALVGNQAGAAMGAIDVAFRNLSALPRLSFLPFEGVETVVEDQYRMAMLRFRDVVEETLADVAVAVDRAALVAV